MNAYAPKLGLFRNRVFPLCSYIIATQPLTPEQWDSIGLQNRRGFGDMLPQFFYAAPSADGLRAVAELLIIPLLVASVLGESKLSNGLLYQEWELVSARTCCAGVAVGALLIGLGAGIARPERFQMTALPSVPRG